MSTETNVPFQFVLLKTRINRRKIEKLEAAGIRVVERTDTRALQLQAEHVAQRGERHYYRLGDRMNAAGQVMGDSGWLRIAFNKDGDVDKAMTVKSVVADLEAIGYGLTDVHVMVRPGEQNGMGFLVLVYQVETDPFVSPTPEASQLVNEYVTGFYRSCYVYENPDDGATVNANTSVVARELEAATDKRHLRFRFDAEAGRTYWESAKLRPSSAEARA